MLAVLLELKGAVPLSVQSVSRCQTSETFLTLSSSLPYSETSALSPVSLRAILGHFGTVIPPIS